MWYAVFVWNVQCYTEAPSLSALAAPLVCKQGTTMGSDASWSNIVPGWGHYYQACTACWKYEQISRLHNKTTYHFIYLRLYCVMAWHAAWSMPCPKTCSTKDLFQSLNISPWPNIRSIRSRWAAAVPLRLAPFLPVKLQVQPKWPSFLQTKQMNSVELNPYCDL